MSDSSDQSPSQSRETRFAAYLSKLNDLKEHNALREVTEREMLFEFIQLNHTRINEYPMLKTQQSSLINLLCHRSTEQPGHEYIKKLLGTFLILLNRYGKAQELGDAGQVEMVRAHLSNTEALLIKSIQGTVYACALTADNCEEIFIRYFGSEAVQHYNGFLESHEMDETFWKVLIDFFIVKRIEEAYEEIIDNDRFTILKNPANVIIRFQFDDVLAKLKQTTQEIQKTRVQNYFERNTREYEYKRAQKFLFEYLKMVRRAFLPPDGTEEDVKYLSRIVGIDAVAKEYKDEMLARLAANPDAAGTPESPSEEAAPDASDATAEPQGGETSRVDFLKQQILASAVGASIGMGIVREDFTKALGLFRPKELEAIKAMVRHFDLPSLQKILFYLLESYFVQLLTIKGEEEGSKVRVRVTRQRRTANTIIDSLQASGLNKIRRKKIWTDDPSRPGMSLFIPKTARELVEIIHLFNIERKLAEKLLQVWNAAPFKVEILLILDLVLISKATTNLKLRLSEILNKYGIGRGRPGPVSPTI